MTPKESLDRAIQVGGLRYWRMSPNDFKRPDPEILDICSKVRELESIVNEFNQAIRQAGFKHRLMLEAYCDDDEPLCGDAPPGYSEDDLR